MIALIIMLLNQDLWAKQIIVKIIIINNLKFHQKCLQLKTPSFIPTIQVSIKK